MAEVTGKAEREIAKKADLVKKVEKLELFIDVRPDGDNEYRLTTIRGKSSDGQDLRIHRLSSLLRDEKDPELRCSQIVGFLDEKLLPEEKSNNFFGEYCPILQERNEKNGRNPVSSYYMPQHEYPWKYFDQVLSKPNMGHSI